MAKEPDHTTPTPRYKTEVTDAPAVSEKTKSEQQAGTEAAKSQAASQQAAAHEAEHMNDPDRDTYVEPPPLNSEADVTDVGRIAEEMNKEGYERAHEPAKGGFPGGINPGEVASRGFAPDGRPATGTYPTNAPVSDEKKFPQGTQDKRNYGKAESKAERDARERDKDKSKE